MTIMSSEFSNALEPSGVEFLKRAINYEHENRLQPALTCYQEGIEILLEVLKGCKDNAKKQHLRDKVNEYMNRAEMLKEKLDKLKSSEKYHEQTRIEDGAVGFDYPAVFRPYLDGDITEVTVEDPYIRTNHQIDNLVRFCEMLVTSCKQLKQVHLVTSEADHNGEKQKENLSQLSSSLSHRGIVLSLHYSASLHDREIRLSNGWTIKIGRGLDYFKKTERFTLGFHDMSLRKCHETTINIFHKKYLRDK